MKQQHAVMILVGLTVVVGAVLLGYEYWGQGSTQTTVDDVVVAKVNDIVITQSEFVREMELRGGKIPGQYQTVEQRRALLDAMIERKAMLLAASAADYDQDPIIRRQLENMMIRKLTQDRIQGVLASLHVGDEEVEQFYQTHKQDYARPARRQVAMIRISLPRKANESYIEKNRARMQDALSEVEALDPNILHFSGVARKYSDERASRYRGGVIGWLVDHPSMKYKWSKQIIEAAFALQVPGELSDVLQTEDGLYLLRLVRSEPASEQNLDEVRDGIARSLLQDKRKAEKQRILAALQNGLNIEVNDRALEKIQPISRKPKLVADRTPPAMP
jgi:parvulin-like peptidyl-prolyl isomerase